MTDKSNNEVIDSYRNQISLARTEIKNLRQHISALKHEHQKEVNLIKSMLGGLHNVNISVEGQRTVPTEGNTPASLNETNQVNFVPIGVIETSFQNKRGVPRQPKVLNNAVGVVVINPTVFNNPEHALDGLQEFSHMWIIFHFHTTESNSTPAKVAPPRLRGERLGVFATRSPHRPCPIGLSLVKIQKIEGNKIYFLGVDMVNGTPVLDIKPYIPQYDYPATSFNTTSVRPPTEGTSDATETMANLQLSSDNRSNLLLSPLDIDTSTPLQNSPYDGEIPPPDLRDSHLLNTPNLDSPSTDLIDGPCRTPLRRLEYERGAPDGQERFTPPQIANVNDGIRVAPWIEQTQRYDVCFTDEALAKLADLIGDRATDFKCNIESLLSEDPRSNYVRTRYPDHEYSCVLEDLSISCVFDDVSKKCTIIAVRSAEDMEN